MKHLLIVVLLLAAGFTFGQNRLDISDQLETGAQGDIVVLNASGQQTYLNIGANGTVLTSDGTTASWQALTAASFTAAGDGGVNQTITDGDTFTIRGDAAGALSTVGVATDILEIDLLLDEQANGIDISQTATGIRVDPDYNEYATETTFDGAADFGVFYDASGTTQKKILLQNLSWSLTDGTTTETVGLGNTVTLVNATTDGFDLTVSATDQITFTYDWAELTVLDVPANASDYIMYYDVSAGDYKRSTISNSAAYQNITTIANTANTTLDATHNVVAIDASTTASTLDLPDAATVEGRIYYIKAEDVTNAATVDPNGAQTIDGAATYSFANADDAIIIQSDGTNWKVLSEKTTMAASSFTAAGDSGANQTITNGDTFTIRGDAAGAISTVGTATDILEIDLLLDEAANGLDISQTATGLAIALDVNELTAGTVDVADELIFGDVSAGNGIVKTTVQDIINLASFDITDGTTTETISNGNTITFDDATARGIDVVVVATDQINVDLDLNELTTENAVDNENDFIAFYDASATDERKTTIGYLVAAGTKQQIFAAHASATVTITAGTLPTTHPQLIRVYVEGNRQYDNALSAPAGSYTVTNATTITLDWTPTSEDILVEFVEL